MSSPNPNNPVPNFFLASTADFKKIPGSPIVYWVSDSFRNAFLIGELLNQIAPAKIGMRTGNNSKYLRLWFEISISKFITKCSSAKDALQRKAKWIPYNKGGEYRKWYGNNEYVVNWENDGFEIKKETIEKYPQLNWENLGWKISNETFYFQPCLTWTFVSSSKFGVRISDAGFIFDVGGSCAFPIEQNLMLIAAYMCTNLAFEFLKAMNPTLNFQVENIGRLPWISLPGKHCQQIDKDTNIIFSITRNDWDSYETSWDFSYFPLLQTDQQQPTLESTYKKVRAKWRATTMKMQHLEEENNRIFIEAYGLQDELTPDVPLSEITLTCNPHYRYGGGKTDEELETQLLTDTMKELISYSIGCMMGRYRLDRPGLIYAHSGNIDFEKIYHRKDADTPNQTDAQSASSIQHSTLNIQHSSFLPDDDGIIPILDMPWFPDDAANRFVEFMKAAWPPETLNENLPFVADTLSPKRGEAPIDTIRRYLSTGFFKDHLKTYKKRPIYWLFSSGKQKAFECLVYLHRYNESTLSRMRSLYVTPLQGNIRSRIEYLNNEQNAATSASDQRKFQKEIDMLKKKQIELAKFDDELRHYADMRISLDLDDGVKVNYGKFGSLLAEVKAITGE